MTPLSQSDADRHPELRSFALFARGKVTGTLMAPFGTRAPTPAQLTVGLTDQVAVTHFPLGGLQGA